MNSNINRANIKYSLGIDISEHNGSINWNAVKKAGVIFAIIRLGYMLFLHTKKPYPL